MNEARAIIRPMRTEIAAATPDGVGRAARILTGGGCVAFPTETVYGLGADATNDRAVARIFEIKGRPRFNPLIIHAKDMAQAAALIQWSDAAYALARRFWPGPLTLVLPRAADCGISLLASAGLDTLAIRVPEHEVAQSLLDAVDRPLAAPSANKSGQVSPTTAEHAARSLSGEIELVLDGGPCRIGVESTIVDLTGLQAVILRPGAVVAEEIQQLAGELAMAPADGAIRAPGMLSRHYATRAPLRLDVRTAEPGERMLGFGPDAPPGVLNLSPTADLREAAANLFAMLRTLDAAEPRAIAVMPIPEQGLGVAINDRLRRAAAAA